MTLAKLNSIIAISPLAIAVVASTGLDSDSAQGAGMALGLILVPLTMIGIIVGLLVTFFTKKSKNAFRYSVLGFAIPSAFTSLIFLPAFILPYFS